MKYCSDFEDMDGFPGCCTSCHEDDEVYGMAMYETIYKGEPVYVCCKVGIWLDEQADKKLMPYEWQEYKGIVILDPDGWRADNKSQFEPITEEEFDKRAAISTLMPVARKKLDDNNE